MKPKILITGATGLIGYNILLLLLEKELPVKALVRSLSKGRRLLPPQCELVVGDITKKESLRNAMAEVGTIYHCAGFPEQWFPDPSTFYRINTEGTRNIVEVALAEQVSKFIYTSTIDVFEGEKGKDFDESQLASFPKKTHYERSKQQADEVVVASLSKGLPAVFLHPAALYGPGPTDSPGINDFVVKLSKKQVPMLLNGGMGVAYSRDVAMGHLLAAEHAPIGSRYILSESYHSLAEVAQVICAQLELPKVPPVMPLFLAQILSLTGELFAPLLKIPPLIPKGQLLFMQWQAKPSCLKAKKELNWKPIALEEGIQKTIHYLKQTNKL